MPRNFGARPVSDRGMPTAKTPDSAAIVLVSLRWNGEPLAARAVGAGESAVLGDAKGALAQLPPDALGGPALVIADNEGGPHVRVPEGKVASIAGRRGVRLVAGPERAALSPGEEASVLFGAFEVTVGVEKAEPAPKRRRVAAGAWIHTAVVAAVHAALLVAGSRAALASSIEEETTVDLDQLRGFLAAAEERSSAADAVQTDLGGQQDTARTNGRNGNGKDAGGERHEGTAGKAGEADSRARNRHFGAPPAPSSADAPTAESEIRDAREFGVAGILNTMNAGSAWQQMAGSSPWGGQDPIEASGGLLGRLTGESEGTSGLSLSGTGEGGGGRGDGIGLGTIGTIGHADGLAGLGTGGTGTSLNGFGFGSSRGRWGRERRKVSVVRWGHGDWISGRLPAEAIRRVIRQNFGRFRACYLHGLLRNPALAGRVTTRFVIGRDGSVSNVGDGGSDLPDQAVSTCVRRAFYGLSFPQPEDGIVTVTYPIVFSNE